MGDREDVAFQALADVRAVEGFTVTQASSLHETVALTSKGYDASAPGYVNQVIVLESAWSPEKTLEKLLEIEQAHGRVRTGERYADRTLDLDLITYGEMVQETEFLTLPHPRAHRRSFVLEPWLEIDAAATVPGLGSAQELLLALPQDG